MDVFPLDGIATDTAPLRNKTFRQYFFLNCFPLELLLLETGLNLGTVFAG